MLQILNILLWNACLAAGLAIAIFFAQRIRQLRFHPNLWHALWLLVLLKLVMPPIFAVPVSVGSIGIQHIQNDDRASTLSSDAGALSGDIEAQETLLTKTMGAMLTPRFAVAISAIGTTALLLVSLCRVRLIGRLVRQAEPAPEWMQAAATTAARQFKLKYVPAIRAVDGVIAPFLWVTPRGPIVVVPYQLVTVLGPDSVRLIIEHELSHYVRRDHWTNTFAMVLGVLFWWNPVVWWARRELRILQESCCDTMVIAADPSQRRRYAETLLKTIDFVASDDATLPTPATAFASCSTFKRRIEMIVSATATRSNSRWLQVCVLLCAVIVLPLGVVYAQDYEAVGKRLKAAVAAGELTGGQARAMFGALKKAGGDKKDQGVDKAKAYLMKVKKELGAAVEAGEISQEDAVKRYQGAEKAIKERMAAGRGHRDTKRITREDFHRAGIEIRKLVAEGKVSKEDARTRLGEMRKMMGAQSKSAGKKDVDWDGIEKRIEGAVKSGNMTREEADAKYKQIKQRMGQKSRGAGKKDVDWDGIKKRIEGAVKSGSMTREEADAKYKQIKQRMAGGRER